MFIETLFIITKIWTVQIYISKGEDKLLWYPNTRTLLSNKKEWTIDILTTWMSLKIAMLSEKSQKKVHDFWFHLHGTLENKN